MPPGTSYFYVAYRVAVGNCVWEKLILSVKAMRLCQLSRGESQRIFSIQQVLTVGYNRLPLWGSWRGAPERVSSAEAGVETALSVKAIRLCQLSQGESQRISSIQQVLTVGRLRGRKRYTGIIEDIPYENHNGHQKSQDASGCPGTSA